MVLQDEHQWQVELPRCEICLVEIAKAQCTCWEDFLWEVIWGEAWEAAEDMLWQIHCEDAEELLELYWEA